MDGTVQVVLLAAHLEGVGKGSVERRGKPQEVRFPRAGNEVSRDGCVAVRGRSEFHAGSVAGKEVAGDQELDQLQEDKGEWWMMT